MTTARVDATSTVLGDGDVLEAGGATAGSQGSGPSATAELYDPSTGVWTPTGSMSQPRVDATATLLNDGDVLVAGGRGDSGGSTNTDTPLASAELYDPATGTWSDTGSMSVPRQSATATLLGDGDVLVAGGLSNPAPLSSAELYDPQTGQWTPTGSMTDTRFFATATLLDDGEVLEAGGKQDADTPLATTELYDPTTGAWTATGSMSATVFFATATLLSDGDVLEAGGATPSASTVSELYDPVAGTWVLTGPMDAPRVGASASLLPDGDVLETGGTTSTDVNSSAEEYDPTTASWSAVGSMSTPRAFATAVTLGTGQVLEAGGQDENGSPLASAELFGSVLVPAVTTDPPSAIGSSSATVSGSIDPHQSPTTYQFQLSTNPQFSSPVTAVPATAADLGAALTAQPVSEQATGLMAGTTYYERLVATNAGGPSDGPIQQFTTLAAPITTSTPPTTPPVSTPPSTTTPPTPPRLSKISAIRGPVVWCHHGGCSYPTTRLRLVSTGPQQVRLLLRAKIHGQWTQVGVTHLHLQTGVNLRRLAGRWHGALFPARRVQILIQTNSNHRWETRKTITLTVRHR